MQIENVGQNLISNQRLDSIMIRQTIIIEKEGGGKVQIKALITIIMINFLNQQQIGNLSKLFLIINLQGEDQFLDEVKARYGKE